jgi:hypothetical protein
MPPISTRQPRARHFAKLTLAGVVALSVVVIVPGLFRNGDTRSVEAAAASAGQDTTSVTSAPADPADRLTLSDEHKLALIASSPLLRMNQVYNAASPEARAALDLFFAPPPPAPAPAPVAAPAPQPVAVVSAPAVSSGSVWDRLAYCEAHGDWTTHTASGFSGGLQFADATWRAYGGGVYAPRAWQASREAQIAIAEKVLADAGWRAWPACSIKLGLR